MPTETGGPLFAWDPISRRYVLLGVYEAWTHTSGGWVGHQWSSVASASGASFGTDLDADGIPDDADNCPPAFCNVPLLTQSDCANRDQRDTNGNLIGDTCCFQEQIASSTNTNFNAEVAAVTAKLPDACDPVPVFRIERGEANLIGQNTIQSITGDGPQEAIKFSASSWLGHGSTLEQSFSDVAFRFCSFYDQFTGDELSEAACNTPARCNAGGAVDSTLRWQRIDVRELGPGPSDSAVVSGTYGRVKTFNERRTGTRFDYVWNWYSLTTDGTIESRQVTFLGGSYTETRGMFASAVLKNGTFFSDRDELSSGSLRADVEFFELPGFLGTPAPACGPPRIVARSNDCINSPLDCHSSWVLPGDRWLDLATGVDHFLSYPALALSDAGEPILSLREDSPCPSFSLDQIGDPNVWTFPATSNQWPFLAPVEPLAFLRKHQIGLRGIRISPKSSLASRAFTIETNDNAIWLRDSNASWDLPAGAGAASSVNMPLEGKAVFSASKRALFLVGGADVAPNLRNRRYDIDSHALDVVPADPALLPSGQVLATTYDFVGDVLYVMDVVGAQARLTAHNLRIGSSRILWQVAYTGGYRSVFLGLADQGRLVLIADQPNDYVAWLVDVNGDAADFIGRFDSVSSVFDTPIAGFRDVTVPVMTPEGHLLYEALTEFGFTEGAPCTAL